MNKNIQIAFCAAVVFVSNSSLAETNITKVIRPASAAKWYSRQVELLQKYDLNGDGVIDEAETKLMNEDIQRNQAASRTNTVTNPPPTK